MEKSSFEVSGELNPDIEVIGKFSDLFAFINEKKLGAEYQESYEATVGIAKHLVETKSKGSWDKRAFERKIADEHPTVQKNFIEALSRCVEHYNPPVNLPNDLAW